MMNGQIPIDTRAGRPAFELLEARLLLDSSLTGVVWADLDGEGIRDGGEPGLDGVAVRLYDNADDSLVDDTSTLPDGSYRFDGLSVGDYYVEFVTPAEHAISPQDQGGDDTVDSDADRVTGRTGVVTVPVDAEVTAVDAGMLVPDRFEQNDSFPAAAQMGAMPGVHINQLTISAPGDGDWYWVELLRDDAVDVTIRFTHAFGDLGLEITDDGGAVLGSSSTSGDVETVSLTGLAAGTYHVHVFGVADAVNVYDIEIEPGATSATTVYYVNDAGTADGVKKSAQ